jgi:hypothetical protein
MREPCVEDVGPGWRDIVAPLIRKAAERGLKILQIKEKFGGLRFYYAPFDEQFNELVAVAEERCDQTCEWCGKPGTKSGFGWIKTLCDEHLGQFANGENWWSENA